MLNAAEAGEKQEQQPRKSSHVIEYEIVPDSFARRRPQDDDPTAPIIQVATSDLLAKQIIDAETIAITVSMRELLYVGYTPSAGEPRSLLFMLNGHLYFGILGSCFVT